jgi:hypothetical protein
MDQEKDHSPNIAMGYRLLSYHNAWYTALQESCQCKDLPICERGIILHSAIGWSKLSGQNNKLLMQHTSVTSQRCLRFTQQVTMVTFHPNCVHIDIHNSRAESFKGQIRDRDTLCEVFVLITIINKHDGRRHRKWSPTGCGIVEDVYTYTRCCYW